MKKCLLIVGGTLSLGLGIVGMFLPILPTTPFLLLAAYCYLRSSQRLYRWLMNHRLLGTYLQDYIKYHVISKGVKIGSITALWLSLAVSIAVIGNTVVRLVLVLVGIGVSIHLLWLKTLPKQAIENSACECENPAADNR